MIDERSFPGKQPNEKVILILHRHWFTFFIRVLLVGLLGGLPVLVFFFWRTFAGGELLTGSLGHVLLVLGGSAYALFLWNLLYSFWLDYALDYFVVSDQRVVDVEQSGLFHRTVAEQDIDRIQDCTSESRGFFPTMLHYGNVYVQTAGEKQRFVFEDVPNPEAVVRQIFHYAELNRNKSVPTSKLTT